MSKKYKRYSLMDKRKYWNNQLDKYSSLGKLTPEEQSRFKYAQGFITASKQGKLDPKFNDINDMSFQCGQIAGFKSHMFNKSNSANRVLEVAKQNYDRPQTRYWG